MDYSVFNQFLSRETWHSLHSTDLEVFYNCLADVVRNENFSPEKMGEHMRLDQSVSRESEGVRGAAVSELVAKAWAIREYLAATSQ